MLFSWLFHKAPSGSNAVSAPFSGKQAAETEALCLANYAVFLNDYVAHGFNESEGETETQGHFYACALQLARALNATELEASHLTEQQRQKARRNYRQLKELAESVLVDQRNYLLARYINDCAGRMGLAAENGPFSGIETGSGQPCHAFALKLLADSSLGRGFARGLEEQAITLLEHHIAYRADREIGYFLHVYQQEQLS